MNMTLEQLQSIVQKLQAENESLKAQQAAKIKLKVSEKGSLSLYGLQKFPVTLYPGQWLSILDMSEQIKTFITENEGKFSTKK